MFFRIMIAQSIALLNIIDISHQDVLLSLSMRGQVCYNKRRIGGG